MSTKVNEVRIVPEMQSMMCDALIKNAKVINGIKYVEIPTELLQVDPSYQREPDGHEYRIAKSWDKRKCGAIPVSYREGAFYIIDGQHRWLAAKIVGERTMTCQVYENMTLHDEALLFGGQEDLTKKLTPRQLFKSKLLGEDPFAVKFNEFCKSYNIDPLQQNPITLKSFAEAQHIYRLRGKECLAFIFDVLTRDGYDGLQYHNVDTFRALRDVWYWCWCKDRVKEGERKLCRVFNPDVSPYRMRASAITAHPTLSMQKAQTYYFKEIIDRRI